MQSAVSLSTWSHFCFGFDVYICHPQDQTSHRMGNGHQNLDVFFQSLHVESIGLLLLHSRLIRPVQIHLQFGWYTFPLSGCLRPLYFPYHQHITFSPTTTLSPGCLLHCHKRLERIGTAAICLVPLRLKKRCSWAAVMRQSGALMGWLGSPARQHNGTVPSDLVPKAWWGDVTKFSFAELLLVFWAEMEMRDKLIQLRKRCFIFPPPSITLEHDMLCNAKGSFCRPRAISFHFVINHGWAHHRKWFQGRPPKTSSRTLQGPLVSHELASLSWSKYRHIQHDTTFQKLKSHNFWSPPGLLYRFSVIWAEAWIKLSMQRTWRPHIRVLVVWQKLRLGDDPKWPTDISSQQCALESGFGPRGWELGEMMWENPCFPDDVVSNDALFFSALLGIDDPNFIIFQLGWNYQLGTCSFFFPFWSRWMGLSFGSCEFIRQPQKPCIAKTSENKHQDLRPWVCWKWPFPQRRLLVETMCGGRRPDMWLLW